MKLHKKCIYLQCFTITLAILGLILHYNTCNNAVYADTGISSEVVYINKITCNYIFNDETLRLSEPCILTRSNVRYLIILFASIHSNEIYDNESDIDHIDPVYPDIDHSETDKDDCGYTKDEDYKNHVKPEVSTSVESNKIPQNDQNIIFDKNNGNESNIDSDDLLWLARIIEAEAGNEPYEGKLAVGSVIINRVKSNEFPSTIYGVIFDSKYGVQFTPTANGTIYNKPSEESNRAAVEILKGNIYNNEILYFVNHDISNSKWFETKKYVFKIGNHTFYK